MTLNPKIILIITGAVLVIVAAIYFMGRRAGKVQAGKRPKPQPLPNNGKGIPTGWNPSGVVRGLHSAMKGAGTDEEKILHLLQPLTTDQKSAVFNEFNRLYYSDYDMNLFDWFNDELSGEDHTSVLNHFSHIRA